MNVVKKNTIIIPNNLSYYYETKAKFTENHTCPECKKKSDTQLFFSEKNRVLSCKCKTPGCLDLRIYTDSYITYDKKYNTIKSNFEEVTHNVLREKFDIIFDFKKAEDISSLTKTYVSAKETYRSLYEERYNFVHPNYTLRDEYIRTLKEDGIVSSEELNGVLNEIHTQVYTKVFNSIIRKPAYALEVQIL
jgi:hypothetical protein